MKDAANEAFKVAGNLVTPTMGLISTMTTLMLVSAASPANAKETWNLEALDLASFVGLASVVLLHKGYQDFKTLLNHNEPAEDKAPKSVANGPA